MREGCSRKVVIAGVLVVLVACGEVLTLGPDGTTSPDGGAVGPGSDGGGLSDGSAAEGGGARCRWDAPFDLPVPIANLNGPTHDFGARLTADERTLYFSRADATGILRIMRATRASITVPFSAAQEVPDLATVVARAYPAVSGDAKTIVFTQIGTSYELWTATRGDSVGNFGAPIRLDALSSPGNALAPFFTADGKELWFASDRETGGYALRLYRTAWNGSASASPALAYERDAGAVVTSPVLSTDKLTLYFGAGTSINTPQIHVARRESEAERFGDAKKITELVQNEQAQLPDWLSADACRLYFTRLGDTIGNHDLYVAGRSP